MTDEVAIPALVPPRSPQELREWTVEDYTVMARSMGNPSDREVIERQTVRDLELYDAIQREHSVPVAASPVALEAQRASREERTDAKAATKGATIQRSDTGTVRVPNRIEHAKAVAGSRWSFAMGRLKRIIAGATAHPDVTIATSTCEMPALARDVFRIQAFVLSRRAVQRPQDERNPFAGLSNEDFARKLQRKIEDICDRSSARLGPWWVPK